MDKVEASAAIKRLLEIAEERGEAWQQRDADRHRDLNEEEKDLIQKVGEFIDTISVGLTP
jgi:hypothetical protein